VPHLQSEFSRLLGQAYRLYFEEEFLSPFGAPRKISLGLGFQLEELADFRYDPQGQQIPPIELDCLKNPVHRQPCPNHRA
jgi:hypothetical protein